MGKCPECGEWSSFVEERERVAPKGAAARGGVRLRQTQPVAYGDIESQDDVRTSSGITEFDRVLADRDVLLVPDILANAGGVTVSYYEWVQDLYSYFWSESQVNEALEKTMRTAFENVYATAGQHKTDMRTGAYILAIGRVAEATRVRGIFP